MQLSAKNAQQIVTEISAIVGQHVNMMDQEGVIIASTDPKRIGSFHSVAKRVIDSGLDELYVDADMESRLMRRGLNLPIMFEGQVVGVVGITGEYEKVVKYGQIVKKMTEILLMDAGNKDKKLMERKIRDRFLDEWVRGSGSVEAPEFVERGLSLGIDITLPRRIMIIGIENLSHYSGMGEGQRLIDAVERRIQQQVQENTSNQLFRTTSKTICIIEAAPNVRLRQFALRLSQQVKEEFGVGLLIGIDGENGPRGEMHTAYNRAMKAWKACLGGEMGVTLYDDITMEIFMESIPRQLKEEYLHKIFKGCSLEQLRRWVQLLEAYFRAEGSITQGAELLYMHKNTMQYKIKRLREQTGFDVRLPSNAALLYVAVAIFRDIEGELLEFGN